MPAPKRQRGRTLEIADARSGQQQASGTQAGANPQQSSGASSKQAGSS